MNIMRRNIIALIFGIISITISAQQRLSDEAYISLMTSDPFEEEVFTVYGHAALRVHDPKNGIDYIFNYGIFDFSKPNFIYRFAKGETDYKLGVANYQDYVIEYQMRGSDITEQRLNLNHDEVRRIWEALVENYKPENRVYRYNFFFDNCATRPAAIIESCVDGNIVYNYPYSEQSFRSLINHCTRNHPWLTFGCDLALGSPTDRLATQHEMMFLPEYLRSAFNNASIKDSAGNIRPIVKETTVIDAVEADEPERSIWDWLTPDVCSWLLLAVVITLTFIEWKGGIYMPITDFTLFLIAGVAGIIIFFLSFISVHPCTSPNMALIWLNPIHIAGAILFCVKKQKRAAYYYHFINFAALMLMPLGFIILSQHLNYAFIPLVASLWVRSGWGIYRRIWKIG